MGAALIIVPVFVVMIGVFWVFYAAGKTSKARKLEDTLPDAPQDRHDEEVRRLKADHADAGTPHAEV